MTNAVAELPSLSEAEEIELLNLLEQERLDDARDCLAKFVRAVDVPGVPPKDDESPDLFYPVRVEPAKHHLILLDALERVESGEIRRLLVMMGPGSAKSTYVSVVFPAWFLGRKDRRSVICTSYGSNLPLKFGRRCRSVAASEEYLQIFGHTLSSESKAADAWALSNGSEYMSAGILAGITGNRADGGIADDLIKGREAADSQTVRDKTWEAWLSDFRTRLKPHGWIVFITTRWHEDDPAGRILPDGYEGQSGWITARDGERWYVLCLQSECTRSDDPLGRTIGDFIWPDYFPREHFEQEKITLGPRNWSALHQQAPQPDTGDYFKAEWFRWYDDRPAHLQVYGASDYAVTADGGDWTVHMVAGLDPHDDLYVLDIWREQADSGVWVESCIDLMAKWKPIKWAEESGQIEKGIGPFLTKRMMERRVYCSREAFSSSHDKATRAQAIRGRMSMGKVYFPSNAPWMIDLMGELLRFPTGVNDDQVDAISLFGRMLDEMYKAGIPPAPVSGRMDDPATILTQMKIDPRQLNEAVAAAEQPQAVPDALGRMNDPKRIMERLRRIREGGDASGGH